MLRSDLGHGIGLGENLARGADFVPARELADTRNARPLRIAMLAPPWISVPPPGYGGIEHVVSLLSEELVARGHDVTLFAAEGSRSSGTVRPLLTRSHPEDIGAALHEADHVARAFAEIDAAREAGEAFDIVHDHCGFTAISMADRIGAAVVHTLHGAFTDDTFAFYAAHGHRAQVVAISHTQVAAAPPALRNSPVIPNPIAVDQWPLQGNKDGYLLWVGRMTEEKGPHRAIDAARRAKRELIIAGPVQPGQEAFFESEIEPHLDGSRVRYVGEVGGRVKTELFARASGLLMPIRWSEPFGMVMIEALACGTPVIAFREGAATEIVLHEANGFLVADEEGMAEAVHDLEEIDPERCRATVAERYDVSSVTDAYDQVYRQHAGILSEEAALSDLTSQPSRPASGTAPTLA